MTFVRTSIGRLDIGYVAWWRTHSGYDAKFFVTWKDSFARRIWIGPVSIRWRYSNST